MVKLIWLTNLRSQSTESGWVSGVICDRSSTSCLIIHGWSQTSVHNKHPRNSFKQMWEFALCNEQHHKKVPVVNCLKHALNGNSVGNFEITLSIPILDFIPALPDNALHMLASSYMKLKKISIISDYWWKATTRRSDTIWTQIAEMSKVLFTGRGITFEVLK